MKKQEFSGISKHANDLIDGQEGTDVDFKKEINGLSSDDLVAFANSNQGGTILIGVSEDKDTNGKQKGVIVGCPIGDEEKRKITDRAANCIPPVEVEIFLENLDEKPFIRIEVPSGKNKPYCTRGGTYKIRGDGVNQALTPQRLFTIFEEKEGDAFIKRFTLATKGLVKQMDQLMESTFILDGILRETLESAQNSETIGEESMSNAEVAAEGVSEIEGILNDNIAGEINSIHAKLNAILANFKIEDPFITDARNFVEETVIFHFSRGESEKDVIDNLKNIFVLCAFHASISWEDFSNWGKKKYSQLTEKNNETP